MATSVAAPLERQFGRIAGVTEMTSSSYRGINQHRAAVRAEPEHRRRRPGRPGRHQCGPKLPARRRCPATPTYRKVNPADAPILILALTSDTADRAGHV